MTKRETTRVCPRCGATALHLFTSKQIKQCSECYLVLPWTLDPDQKPLFGPSRSVK